MLIWQFLLIVIWICWGFTELSIAVFNDDGFNFKKWDLRTSIFVGITSLVGLYLIVKYVFIENNWLFEKL